MTTVTNIDAGTSHNMRGRRVTTVTNIIPGPSHNRRPQGRLQGRLQGQPQGRAAEAAAIAPAPPLQGRLALGLRPRTPCPRGAHKLRV